MVDSGMVLISLNTHSLPGFAGDLNGGVLVVLGGSYGALNGGVLLVLGGGGVVWVNSGGGVGLGFGGLTLDPEAAGESSFTNLFFSMLISCCHQP